MADSTDTAARAAIPEAARVAGDRNAAHEPASLPAALQWAKSNKRALLWSGLSTFAWMFVAHAYRWFSATSASHDGLAFVSGADEALHQIALGRFLEPAYAALRGGVASPLLVGLAACLFAAAAVFLLAKVIGDERPWVICALSGAICTHIAVTFMNATYTAWFDADMLALALAVGAVCACTKPKAWFAAGGALLCCSLALYQSYLQMFLAVALIAVLARAMHNVAPAELGRLALRLLGGLAVGALAYVACLNAAMALFGVAATDGYNGLASVGDYSQASPVRLAVEAYALPLAYLLTPETHCWQLAGAAGAAGLAGAVAGFARVCRARRVGAPATAIGLCCIAALPFAVACVYVVSRGVMHGLMIHSFCAFFVLAALVAAELTRLPAGAGISVDRVLACVLGACLAVVFACNVVYAHELYLRKDLESQSTLSTMTRVLDRIEQAEGYVPGKTPVALVGSLNNSALALDRAGLPPYPAPRLFSNLTAGVRGTGFYGPYAPTHYLAYAEYLSNVLGQPVNLVDEQAAALLADDEQVKAMPAFPDRGSCQVLDGTVVMKLSDDEGAGDEG